GHPAQRRRRVRALDRERTRVQARSADAPLRRVAAGGAARHRAVPGRPAMSVRPDPALDAPGADPAQTARLHAAWKTPPGWRYWSSVNNTNVGRWYTGAAISFFLFAGLLALLMRLQLALPDNDL